MFDNESIKNEILRDVFLLSGCTFVNEKVLLADLQTIIYQAPLRHMKTKMGFVMSVEMTNCGKYGWISDHIGYRYEEKDPLTDLPWPEMPDSFQQLANLAANKAGFINFQPDACLINRYKVGASMGLHQDKDEKDFNQPIVSVSFGVPAILKFGGLNRTDKTIKIPLMHSDVVVWGGEARLNFHGIMPIKKSYHPVTGEFRINMTFRKAG